MVFRRVNCECKHQEQVKHDWTPANKLLAEKLTDCGHDDQNRLTKND